jgi:hypothetical protein
MRKGKNISTQTKEQLGIIDKMKVQLRGEEVMLDVHMAQLLEMNLTAFKKTVRRNIERFPADFIFKVTEAEIESLLSLGLIPNKEYLGDAQTWAFTDLGMGMLTFIVKHEVAISISIDLLREERETRECPSIFRRSRLSKRRQQDEVN